MNANPSRQIVAFMAFAMAFAVIGHTVKSGGVSNPVPLPGTGIKGTTTDVKILLGGSIGTVLLVLLASTGSGAASFAKGLAGVTLLSSILINGAPVFGAVSKLSGAKTTAPATTTTTTTKASTTP